MRINGILAQKSALAGVAKPRNPVVCLVSTLNLANRHAEATGTAIAAAGIDHHRDQPPSPRYQSRSVGPSSLNTNQMIIPGATPNVTISAKLSNCAPSGVPPPKARAASPSNTSNSAPANTSQHAHVSCPCEASRMEPTPHPRFAVVKRSGILGRRAIELKNSDDRTTPAWGRSWDKFGQ